MAKKFRNSELARVAIMMDWAQELPTATMLTFETELKVHERQTRSLYNQLVNSQLVFMQSMSGTDNTTIWRWELIERITEEIATNLPISLNKR